MTENCLFFFVSCSSVVSASSQSVTSDQQNTVELNSTFSRMDTSQSLDKVDAANFFSNVAKHIKSNFAELDGDKEKKNKILDAMADLDFLRKPKMHSLRYFKDRKNESLFKKMFRKKMQEK